MHWTNAGGILPRAVPPSCVAQSTSVFPQVRITLYIWLVYELVDLKNYVYNSHISNKSASSSFVFLPCMQTTHHNLTAPILDLTVDQPVFSRPNHIDLTKAASSTALSSKNALDPTQHAAASPK